MEASGRAVGESEASGSDVALVLDSFGAGDVTSASMRALSRGARRPQALDNRAVLDVLAGVVIDGEVQGLPLFQERADTAEKQRADSSIREGAVAWLNSLEGQVWLNKRKVLE